jgi:hypothetical protein
MPDFEFLAATAATGAAAGLLAGLLGVGGGLIIVPALHALFLARQFPPDHLMHLAIGTSLASVAFTAVSSAWSHHRHGAVLWRTVHALAPGIVVGAAGGAVAADRLSSPVLRICFGVFACLIAVQIARNARPAAGRVLPGAAVMFGAGSVIGGISTLVGIGGGSLTVPFLLWCNVNLRHAVATSAACGLPIALAGAATMIVVGADHAGLPAGATGYVHWPAALAIAATSVACAPLGALLAHRLPLRALRVVFAILLLAMGLHMIGGV